MRVHKNRILELILLSANAFVAFPVIIFGVFKKKKSCFTLALFFAILGFFFIPNEFYDLARYYKTFTDEQYRFAILTNQKDYFARSVINFLVYYNLSKNLLAFICAFITYYFIFKAYEDCMEDVEIKGTQNLILSFLCFLLIPILGYSGVRFWPGVSIFIYALFSKSKKVNILLPVISIFFHISLLFPVVIYYVVVFFLKKRFVINREIIFIGTVLGLLLSPNILLWLVNWINGYNIVYIPLDYLIGEYGVNSLEGMNLLYKIVIRTIFIFALGIILYFNIFLIYKKEDVRINNFILLFSLTILPLFHYQTFFERYSSILVLIIFLISIPNILKKNIEYNHIGILIFLYGASNFIFDIKRYVYYFWISYKDILSISLFNVIRNIFNHYG